MKTDQLLTEAITLLHHAKETLEKEYPECDYEEKGVTAISAFLERAEPHVRVGRHLRFDYMRASIKCGENRHAVEVMRELGITYQHATPQSICDQYWFWNCENVPNELPEYLTPLNLLPKNMIGYGLSKEDAEKIENYQRHTP